MDAMLIELLDKLDEARDRQHKLLLLKLAIFEAEGRGLEQALATVKALKDYAP